MASAIVMRPGTDAGIGGGGGAGSTLLSQASAVSQEATTLLQGLSAHSAVMTCWLYVRTYQYLRNGASLESGSKKTT